MYQLELDGKILGETRLEVADPPMGVVGGKIIFAFSDDPYIFLKSYCESHGIQTNQSEDAFVGFIDAQHIRGLKIFRADGVEIAGLSGASIRGVLETDIRLLS